MKYIGEQTFWLVAGVINLQKSTADRIGIMECMDHLCKVIQPNLKALVAYTKFFLLPGNEAWWCRAYCIIFI